MFQKIFATLFMGSRVQSAKPIEPLTRFLVNNDIFVRTVLGVHTTSRNLFAKIDRALEEELLDKEHTKEIGSKTSRRKNNNNNKY